MNKGIQMDRFNRIYPWLSSLSDDLLFYIAINTLFLSIVKGYSTSQIVLLTTIPSLISLLLRVPIIKFISKIGNTISVRIGMLFLLIASILITFSTSYSMTIVGQCFYQIAFIFTGMINVMLRNNLEVQNREDDYVKLRSKSSTMYAITTTLIAFISGWLFNLNNYIPMILCITVCLINFITSFYVRDLSNKDVIYSPKKEKIRLKYTKALITIFIFYGLFYALVEVGQQNSKLFIQYELTNSFNVEKMSIILSTIIAISRIVRVISNISFNKLYKKLNDKMPMFLSIVFFNTFVFLILGYFITNLVFIKFALMSIGFFIILATRDPLKIYTQNLIFKICDNKESQLVIAYLEFARKVGSTILSFLVAMILLKLEMVYVITLLGILGLINIFIAKKLYLLIK